MSYLKNLDELARDERQMKALTGASIEEIELLAEHFAIIERESQEKEREQKIEQGTKERKWGGGKKPKLDTNQKKVFFCLNYLKTYPTYDVLAHNFNLCRSAAHANTHRLIPILAKTFEKLGCKPMREIINPEDFLEAFGNIEKLIIDGVERKYFRSKKYETQKADYSGKKKGIPRKI